MGIRSSGIDSDRHATGGRAESNDLDSSAAGDRCRRNSVLGWDQTRELGGSIDDLSDGSSLQIITATVKSVSDPAMSADAASPPDEFGAAAPVLSVIV